MTKFLMTVVTMMCLAFANPVSAQNSQQSQNFSQADIASYVNSAMEISKIQQKMAPQIQSAESEDDKKAAYQQMQKEMMGVLESAEDMSVEAYNAISRAAQKDKELAQQIQEQFQTTMQ